MNILNTKHIGLSFMIEFSFCLNLNAQKPRKIFNYLQEKIQLFILLDNIM